jgi:hypothetical protein
MISRLFREVVDKKMVRPMHWGLCKGSMVGTSQLIKPRSRHQRGGFGASRVSAGPRVRNIAFGAIEFVNTSLSDPPRKISRSTSY